MPNIKSAKKRVLVNTAKNLRNQSAKSALKTSIKKFDSALLAGDAGATDAAFKAAVKAIDKAAAGNILHKNNAARKKSAMQLKLNAK